MNGEQQKVVNENIEELENSLRREQENIKAWFKSVQKQIQRYHNIEKELTSLIKPRTYEASLEKTLQATFAPTLELPML